MIRRITAPALSVFLLACATTPTKAPIQAPVLTPGANEKVAIDQLVVLIDGSSSVPANSLFQDQKTLNESFVRSMPDGNYEAGSITFGGFERETDSLAAFDRGRVVSEATSVKHLDEGTPIDKAIAEAGEQLAGKNGRAAIVLYSDGLLTDEIGRERDPELAFQAIDGVKGAYKGDVCLHTVQTGRDPKGAEFLRALAARTDCGTFRAADGVTNVASLQQFQRDVFIGQKPAQVASKGPGDLDGDGIIDVNDQCPGTPRGAPVDMHGCWVVKGLLFDFDSAKIDPSDERALDDVATVLRDNPNMRVRLNGYTDSVGTDEYNMGLSNRRADAARNYLVSAGIDRNRMETIGSGKSNPVANNATAAGRAENRRTIVDIIE